jgi:proton-translocating NADH-quinone oxidoreductase chain M
MLIYTVFVLPIWGMISLFFTNSSHYLRLKQIALGFSIITFYFSLLLWVLFDKGSVYFQYLGVLPWFSFLGLPFVTGLDGLSLFFVLLTTFLIPICLLASWKMVTNQLKGFLILLLALELCLLLIFSVLDVCLFFIFFESVLIPMFLIIGIWGSRERRIRASYFFFLYTLLGSIMMLLGILLILFETGTTNLCTLAAYNFTEERQVLLWLMFFISFSVKLPIVPFHIWLPEAHVEAPTIGSVILAGILLKLGVYGLLRFSFTLFPLATAYFTPFVYTISIVSILYSSLTTLRQADLKRVIAYSSVAHMNFGMLGLFSNTVQGVVGGLLLSISHGFVTSGIFLCIGVLYDRYHTRLVSYYSGLSAAMPVFSFVFFLFSLSNLGFPGTSSFIGELLIVVGSFTQNHMASFLGTLGILLGTLYTIWLYNRICFGNIKVQYSTIYFDLSRREFLVLSPLLTLIFALGMCPSFITDYLLTSSYFLVTNLHP